MNTIKEIGEVKLLVSEIQQCIDSGEILFMNERPANRQTLADLGITQPTQMSIIKGLQAEDYCGGPDGDEKYHWKKVVLFGKIDESVELYIKLSFGIEGSPVVCISFHKAREPMKYQFK